MSLLPHSELEVLRFLWGALLLPRLPPGSRAQGILLLQPPEYLEHGNQYWSLIPKPTGGVLSVWFSRLILRKTAKWCLEMPSATQQNIPIIPKGPRVPQEL